MVRLLMGVEKNGIKRSHLVTNIWPSESLNDFVSCKIFCVCIAAYYIRKLMVNKPKLILVFKIMIIMLGEFLERRSMTMEGCHFEGAFTLLDIVAAGISFIY